MCVHALSCLPVYNPNPPFGKKKKKKKKKQSINLNYIFQTTPLSMWDHFSTQNLKLQLLIFDWYNDSRIQNCRTRFPWLNKTPKEILVKWCQIYPHSYPHHLQEKKMQISYRNTQLWNRQQCHKLVPCSSESNDKILSTSSCKLRKTYTQKLVNRVL